VLQCVAYIVWISNSKLYTPPSILLFYETMPVSLNQRRRRSSSSFVVVVRRSLSSSQSFVVVVVRRRRCVHRTSTLRNFETSIESIVVVGSRQQQNRERGPQVEPLTVPSIRTVHSHTFTETVFSFTYFHISYTVVLIFISVMRLKRLSTLVIHFIYSSIFLCTVLRLYNAKSILLYCTVH